MGESRTQHDLTGISRRFWREAAAMPRRALFLDYDGTLAPFRVVRADSRPIPGVTRLLSRIAGRVDTTLAIVSGRPIAELSQLLPGLPMHLVGEHGWESQCYGSAVVHRAISGTIANALSAATHAAASAGFAKRLERKRTSVVIHFRGLASARAGRIEGEALNLWRTFARDGSLILRRTHGGLELRAAGHTKGTAVREVLTALPKETFSVYVGDDETDEDAFHEIRDRGFAVWVGSERNPAASGWLPSCAAVRTFLEMWEREMNADGN